ncbi:unannotated protein [freshwater metagenome]|uniref:Unannotated protein n=1 Tax=freshwater metagenome TaxID=449393 RepID=A0A6J7RH04_9ZZZZ
MRCATVSTIRLEISCAVKPISVMIWARLPCSRNSVGIPKFRTLTSRSWSRNNWLIEEPTPPSLMPSSTVTTNFAARANPTSAGEQGFTQRGSTTNTPIPCARSRSATSMVKVATAPMLTISTSGSPDSAITSRSEMIRSAGAGAASAPFGKRITVGASSTKTASRSAARKVDSSRGAAIRSPGTTCNIAISHMPL